MEENKKELAPNKVLKPIQHQQWKVIGHLLEFNDATNLKRKEDNFVTFWKRFAKRITALVGLFILIFLVMGAIIIPFFTNNPKETDVNRKFLAPGEQDYIFGTDKLGRDFWAYIWHGMRFSLSLGLFAATIDFIVGTTLGLLMGHFKKFDRVMQYFIKVFVNIPSILILILATIVFDPTFFTLAIGLTITGWIPMSLNVRAQVMKARNFQWVTASKFLGTPNHKILRNYIPVALPLVITQIVLTISSVILAETSISFIGLGVPNQPSLGSAITVGSKVILTFPRYTLIPASFLIGLTLSLQLISTEIERAIVRQR